MNIHKSLITKYLLLILASLLMWPILPAIYYSPDLFVKQGSIYEIEELDQIWKQTAEQLNEANEHTINQKLRQIQEQFPNAKLFWVDQTGRTHLINGTITDIPDLWTPANLIQFIDRKDQQGLHTITATMRKKEQERFLVFQIPKSDTTLSFGEENFFLTITTFLVGLSLVILSWLFFLGIRKRLIQLRNAMSITTNNGLPDKIKINQRDEIGQLEKAFNQMVLQLKNSRKREKEEEQLRKQWIANLSHDLRTPLTVIQHHAYRVQRNPSSSKATESIKIMINKLNDVEKLLENLLTYTLLSAGKHPLKRRYIDVVEELRQMVADWLPVLEKEDFVVDVDLPDQALHWNVDPLWLRCILDNLMQNVMRYAKSGRYVGIGFIERNGSMHLFIKDQGQGIEQRTETKGAGIGLSIVSLMTNEMNIDWEVSNSSRGTSHFLSQNLNTI